MPSLEDEFNSLPYEELYSILEQLSSYKELNGKFIVAGGTVPYILSETSSGREHGDIDILVKEKDMPIIRKFLKKHGMYDKRYDSLSYAGTKIDHGVTTKIKGLPVEFYPYKEVIDKKTGKPSIDARTYSFGKNEKEIFLKENHIVGITEEDMFTQTKLDSGNTIKTVSPECLIVMKLSIGKGRLREKDKADLMALKGQSLDFEKLERVYKAFNGEETERTLVAKEQEKYSLEEIIEYFSPKIEPISKEELSQEMKNKALTEQKIPVYREEPKREINKNKTTESIQLE